MTRDEATALLGATRPSDERLAREAADGEVLAAFDALRADESLERWYEAECALDEVIGERLRSALGAPPEYLRERVLAAMAAIVPEIPAIRETTAMPLRAWMGIAAGIMVLGIVGLALREGWFTRETATAEARPALVGEGVEFVSFRESMSDYANGKIKLAMKDEDTVALVDWVVENSGPAFEALPEKMNALVGIGCTVIEWDGRKVSLFCFRNTTNGHIAHLFVIDRGAFPSLPRDEVLRSPEVCCGLESVAWNDEAKVYLLVAHAPNFPVSEFF